MKNDPRSYDRNFCNCIKKPEKNSGLEICIISYASFTFISFTGTYEPKIDLLPTSVASSLEIARRCVLVGILVASIGLLSPVSLPVRKNCRSLIK